MTEDGGRTHTLFKFEALLHKKPLRGKKTSKTFPPAAGGNNMGGFNLRNRVDWSRSWSTSRGGSSVMGTRNTPGKLYIMILLEFAMIYGLCGA